MKLRRRRPPWLARATKAAALVGAQRRRLQPTTKAVELVCPNMRLLAAYCLMGTVAAPRGVPLSSSGPNINAAAMGDVQQPSRMSRWSKEVPSHVQDKEEEASKRQRVERPLPCAEGGGEAGPSADDSDSACEAQEEGEEEELEDEEVGEEEAVRKTGVYPPPAAKPAGTAPSHGPGPPHRIARRAQLGF